MTPLILSADAAPLLDAVRAVTSTHDLPPTALIGGLAVTVRVVAPETDYRATGDIDLVTNDTDPSLIELLTTQHETSAPVQINGVKVDVIPTYPITDDDLDGIEDGPRLFVAGHRWALDTAEPLSLATPTTEQFIFNVATPAALLATKCHAVGYARSQRRATKHGSDMLDVYRLIEAHDRDGQLSEQVRHAPGDIAPIIARIVRTEILDQAPRAATAMTLVASLAPIDPADLADVLEPFVNKLDTDSL